MIKLEFNKLSRFWLQGWGKKGIALYLALSMILMSIILANVILSIILSQSRLTQHQLGRIQAYYAAWAGVNYAIDSLRQGTWPMPGSGSSYTRNLCNGCTNPGDVDEPDLPSAIQNVLITISDRDAPNCDPPLNSSVCVSAAASYITLTIY